MPNNLNPIFNASERTSLLKLKNYLNVWKIFVLYSDWFYFFLLREQNTFEMRDWSLNWKKKEMTDVTFRKRIVLLILPLLLISFLFPFLLQILFGQCEEKVKKNKIKSNKKKIKNRIKNKK